MRIAFVPIDNRPVCYQLPKMIADMDSSVEFFIPQRDWLGDLKKYANTDCLLDWLESLNNIDALILPLDTVAYGGLISSRRCEDSFEEISYKLSRLKSILLKTGAKVYAFSSVMRISNNNVNEEEKVYWADYGVKIFEYSYNFHKSGTQETSVPKEILEDYLKTRKRNFEVNKIYLEWQKEGVFDTLIFSKDDCAPYGLNVMEALELEKLGGLVRTGADEIPLTLLARALKKEVKVCPIFLEPECKGLVSNYEDVSIEKSVLGQLDLAGCRVVSYKEADVLLYVNNFRNQQGEIVMKRDTEPFSGEWQRPEKPYMIADVRFANGADNAFVHKLFDAGLGENFCGYSAWNTSANSLGSLICAMKYRKGFDENFKRLQVVRFLDDWAYQANVRQMLKTPDKNEIVSLMKPYEDVIRRVLNVDFSASYSFPWNRLFEVEVELS